MHFFYFVGFSMCYAPVLIKRHRPPYFFKLWKHGGSVSMGPINPFWILDKMSNPWPSWKFPKVKMFSNLSKLSQTGVAPWYFKRAGIKPFFPRRQYYWGWIKLELLPNKHNFCHLEITTDSAARFLRECSGSHFRFRVSPIFAPNK